MVTGLALASKFSFRGLSTTEGVANFRGSGNQQEERNPSFGEWAPSPVLEIVEH